jgi:hypothetical protein
MIVLKSIPDKVYENLILWESRNAKNKLVFNDIIHHD